jgi:tetratricopeptide (TPR) repeat protein
VTLGGACVVYLAWLDPAFWRLAEENAQYSSAMDFAFKYLPGNYGIEPLFAAVLPTETVADRLTAAVYFMGRGWWAAIAASALLVIVGAALARRLPTAPAVALVLGLLGVSLGVASALVGELMVERAEGSMTAGRHADAIAQYERARWLDPQLTRSERIELRLGEAHVALGDVTRADARFYLGVADIRRADIDAGLAKLRLAIDNADARLKPLVERRTAWEHSRAGIAAYGKGLPGTAAGWWERALTFDRDHLPAVYFLTRAYFDQGRYRESADVATVLLARSRSKLLNAQIQMNLGDAYWKLGDLRAARTAYEAAVKLDTFENYRILKALGGT